MNSTVNHTFSIYGVHCSQCLKKLKALKLTVPGLEDIVVDMSRQQLKAFTNSEFDSNFFIESTVNLGFQAKEIKIDEISDSIENKIQNQLLAKLGVAGAVTGNIMLLSYSVYLGAPKEFSSWFNILSGALYLPIFFYSATPFFSSSISAIKNKKPSIDHPLALAILVGSLLSYYNLWLGSNNIYFDSLGALVFLILCSRYIVQRFQVKYCAPIALQDIFPKQIYKKVFDEKLVNILGADIQLDDQFIVNEMQVIPVDSLVINDYLLIDNSLMTGESEPVRVEKGAVVFAGAKSLSCDIKLKATKTQKTSRIESIIEKIEIALQKDCSVIQLTDSFAQYFTYGLFAIGLVFFVFYSFINLNEAVHRVLALFVIACPCALAITTPIVLRLSAKNLLKKNFLIKKMDVFEKLSRCKAVVFDKTGTLTFASSKVLSWWPNIPSIEDASVITSLEEGSTHPVAKAIMKSLSKIKGLKNIKMEGLKEITGKGVEGNFESTKYSLLKLDHKEGDIGYYKDGNLIYVLKTQSYLRPEVKNEIKIIKAMGLETYMLTGDSELNAQKLAEESGFGKEYIFANQSPEQKNNFVQELSLRKNIVYIGDGLNDSLAMTSGLVGVSMNQSVESTFSASSIHILQDSLSGVGDLFIQSKQTLKTIKKLLGLSVLYNLTFAFLALSGVISPLVASILMPISSLCLLLFGVYQTREVVK